MSGKAGKNREDYRKNNRGHVLKLVATGECRNRTELTKAMGLSKMSISRIVSEMMGAGLLEEEGTAGSDEPGRASSALGISPNAPLAAGLLIQREYCEALLCDLKMQILRREKIFFRQDMDNDKLLDVVYQVLDTLLYREERVIGIGVSSVGPISASEGMILKPLFFFDIQNVPIVKCLEQRYHLPVFLDHDNQCAAVCEFLYGVGRGFHDVLFLGVGTGVGCGIISNGLRYRNERGLPPEIGHVSIDVNGKPCPCGSRGCVEVYTRTPEVLTKLQYHSGKRYNYKTFCTMRDNPLVENIMLDTVTKLGAAVVSTINILNSELLILGNDAVDWDDRYVKEMEKIVNHRRFVEWSDPVTVRRAAFGTDAFPAGSACIVWEHVFAGNLLFESENEGE